MYLRKLIDELRQLQVYRKGLKKHNKTIKMSHLARVKIEEGVPLIWVQVTITEAHAIIIVETNRENGLRRYHLAVHRDEIETYRSDYDQLEINFFKEVQKSDVLILFENNAQRIEFEVALRYFMENGNTEVDH